MPRIQSTEENLQSGTFFFFYLKSRTARALASCLWLWSDSRPVDIFTPRKEVGLPRPLAMTSLRLATFFFFLHHKNSVTKDFYERCLVTARWHRNTATPSLFALPVCQVCNIQLFVYFPDSSSVLRSSRTCDGVQLTHLQRPLWLLAHFVVEPQVKKSSRTMNNI